MAVEKRDFPRVEIAWPVNVATANGLVNGTTENLSLGGSLIRCPEVPDLEETFRLVFRPSERILLLATAEMVWSEIIYGERQLFHAMGVRFRYIPDPDKQVIGEAISKQLH